jgi:hypothetical protein
MAEDSGAFKTNQVKSRRIRPFYRDPEYRCNPASPGRENADRIGASVSAADFSQAPAIRCGILESA